MSDSEKIVAVIFQTGMISGMRLIRKLKYEPTLETMRSLIKKKLICSSTILIDDEDMKNAYYAPLSRAVEAMKDYV
jgi:hypothetical protein